MTQETTKTKSNQKMADLLTREPDRLQIFQEGDMIKGHVLSVGKNEVYVDIDGIGVGVVRGRELYDDEQVLSAMAESDEVYATVINIENKEGNIELSFRKAGQERVWQRLKELKESGETVTTKILEANKGGLMVKINNVMGFLPVSQLSPVHYPRVEDGDKNKILAALQNYVGQDFDVKVITADQEGEKLVVSEKEVIKSDLMEKINKLAIGDVVEGEITGVVDFGAFVRFGNQLEGLVHISELAWQRIDDPKDIVRVGDKVKAQVIAIDDDRVSLSVKRLQKDPWEDAVKKYKVGQVVEGKVLKIAPFGAFVELDENIHGLAHLGELSDKDIEDPSKVLKEGEEREFKIISIEPQEHRLGLSIKALQSSPPAAKNEEIGGDKEGVDEEPKNEEVSEKTAEEVKDEVKQEDIAEEQKEPEKDEEKDPDQEGEAEEKKE